MICKECVHAKDAGKQGMVRCTILSHRIHGLKGDSYVMVPEGARCKEYRRRRHEKSI